MFSYILPAAGAFFALCTWIKRTEHLKNPFSRRFDWCWIGQFFTDGNVTWNEPCAEARSRSVTKLKLCTVCREKYFTILCCLTALCIQLTHSFFCYIRNNLLIESISMADTQVGPVLVWNWVCLGRCCIFVPVKQTYSEYSMRWTLQRNVPPCNQISWTQVLYRRLKGKDCYIRNNLFRENMFCETEFDYGFAASSSELSNSFTKSVVNFEL